MPLRVNVGLSRKIGEENYSSRGASVNVEMELDSGLVSAPGKLQERIRQLFGLVRTSLAEELNGGATGAGQAKNGAQQPAGNGNGTQKSTPARPATGSQCRALAAITKEQRLNLADFLHERFQVRRPEDLSITQASDAIDQLKSLKH